MSYDEIDFTEHLSEDDIDIDIDLETGQNNEDYILEDVNSDVGHEEALSINDDVMIDDENVSYPMDDVDTILEEHIEMQDADLSDIPATEFNNPGLNTNLERNAPPQSVGVDEAPETVIDESHSYEEPLGVEAEHIPGEQTSVEKTRTINADSTLSPPTSPLQHDTGAHRGADSHIPVSDLVYSPSFNADPGSQDPTDSIAIPTTSTATGRIQDEPKIKTRNGDSILLAAEKVVVMYRNAEYALCSSSESDDPDTFFLKDVSLITGTLADLMAGIREIIHEDLRSEDELCLAVEDLGIEINETCMSVHDVTFASIIDLHERLQLNDGVKTPEPLYVTLDTKSDFAKRLAKLIAVATDGKGMSDLIRCDGESEVFDEDIGESEKLENTDEHAEGLNASTDSHENDLAVEGAKEEQVPENVNFEQDTGSKAEGVEAQKDHSALKIPEDHGRLGTPDHIPSQAKVSEYSKDGLDEDGDFIDYEDEEYGQSHETSASANIDSSGKQYGNSPHFITRCSGLASCTCPPCMKHPLIYDEENKSEPDQRSPIPAPEEDRHHVQLDSNAPHSAPMHSDQYRGENVNREADNEDGEFSRYSDDDEYEGDGGWTNEQIGEDPFVSYDGIQEEDKGKNGNVVADVIALNAEEAPNSPELGHHPEVTETRYGDDLEEIDYNATVQDLAGIEQTDNSIASAFDNQGSKTLTADGLDQDEDEISYEEADNAGSNESEHTLIADEFAPDVNFEETQQEHNDEINYDTDDQQELSYPSNQKASSEASPVSNGHTGKRQRVDAEDATDRASKKQSKRARS